MARTSTVRHPHWGRSKGNAVREGPGETRLRTGPAAEDRRAGSWCETMPTPGAAPRGRMARRHRRRVDRPREPLPTRVRDTPALPAAYADALDAGLSALGAGADPGGPRRDRRSRPAAAGVDRGDQPDGHPRARRGRGRSRRGQPDRRPSPPRTRGRPVHRPRVGRRLPGHPARGGAAERADAAPRADRQEGRVPVRRGRRDRASRTRSRPRRSGRRPSPPTPAIADAGRPSPPAPSRPWPTSSSSRSRCSNRVAASSPGSAATSARSWLPRTGRSPRSAGARWRSRRSPFPGSTGTSW